MNLNLKLKLFVVLMLVAGVSAACEPLELGDSGGLGFSVDNNDGWAGVSLPRNTPLAVGNYATLNIQCADVCEEEGLFACPLFVSYHDCDVVNAYSSDDHVFDVTEVNGSEVTIYGVAPGIADLHVETVEGEDSISMRVDESQTELRWVEGISADSEWVQWVLGIDLVSEDGHAVIQDTTVAMAISPPVPIRLA